MTELRATLIDDLRTSDPSAFVARHMFDSIPHAFGGDRDVYVSWKTHLAEGLGVDPADVTVVGSAAMGISLNPVKNFREFGPGSDVDTAIVSPYFFSMAWRFLRQNPRVRATLPYRPRAAWDDHKTRLIYWGTIATDQLLTYMPFGKDWRLAIDAVEARAYLTHPINIRIYNDYDALRQYQVNSVKRRRNDLLVNGV